MTRHARDQAASTTEAGRGAGGRYGVELGEREAFIGSLSRLEAVSMLYVLAERSPTAFARARVGVERRRAERIVNPLVNDAQE